jgi:hypothetical protein
LLNNKFYPVMKKCYAIVVLLLTLAQASLAQNKQQYGLVSANQPFSNPVVGYTTSPHHDGVVIPQVSEELTSHLTTIAAKMEALKTSGMQLTSGTGTEYDVKYYRLFIRINPDTSVGTGRHVAGNVTTYFTTRNNNLSQIKFDFKNALTCDSVYYGGVKLAAGNIVKDLDTLKITIPTIAAAGTLDSIRVFYRGTPPTVTDFGGTTGYVRGTHVSNGATRAYIYTLSEPYSASNWWPCKGRVVNDKADSMDIFVSTPVNDPYATPNALKVAANGTLISETVLGTNNRVTHWRVSYPIAAYQACIGVANYVQYPAVPTQVNIGGTNMPYFNYLWPETNTANAQTSLNRLPLMLTTYSSLYGDYPFKNEKYGNYTFGFSGGMEHNTFSGEGPGVYDQATDWSTLAHELGHQWWGASVTCASWKDIWINESFARYSEPLLLEFAPSIASSVGTNAVANRGTLKSSALAATYTNNTTHTTYRNDTASITTIFSPSVYIYDRGAMIISMMRLLMGDTKFFQSLKNIQGDPVLKTGNAYTNDIRQHMEAASGLNLNSFYTDWIYNRGYATYPDANNRWNNFGNAIVIQLVQTSASSNITHFDMPIAIRIQGSAGQDTTVVVYDQAGQLYYVSNNGVLGSNPSTNTVQYNLSFTPVTVTFDAFNQILATGGGAGGVMTKNASLVLDTRIVDINCVKDNGNVNIYWNIDNSLDYDAFEIEKSTDGQHYNNIGIVKSQQNTGIHNFQHIDYDVAPGVWYYRIKIIQKSGAVQYSAVIPVTIGSKASIYSVTPNPAKDVITIASTEKVGNVNIGIYTAGGDLVSEFRNKQLNGQSIKLVVSNLSAGTYFIKISRPGQSVYTKSLVIIP